MSGNKHSGIAVMMIVIAMAFSSTVVADAQDLSYDSFNNATNISYDSLNRILQKNFSSGQHNYSYDAGFEGTLSNVSFANGSVSYEYDEKLRVVKEVRIIDGVRFEKQVVYDSGDRVVRMQPIAGVQLDYGYTAQGLMDGVEGFVNGTRHNAFGNVLNRSYNNNKVTNFTYDGSNGRLIRINTDTIQNLRYDYDEVGNIVSINDSANARFLTMRYDNLDRLVNVSINGARSFVYVYDALGNLLKIVRDSSSTLMLYGNKPVHAPYKVITGNASSDLQGLGMLDNSNKSRVFAFYVANERNGSVSDANWSVEFGDGNRVNSTLNMSLAENEFMAVFVEHDYAEAGSYVVNVTSGSNSTPSDVSVLNVRFGVSMLPVSVVSRNITNVSYSFVISNGLADNASGVSWQCNTGQGSGGSFVMAGLSNVTVNQVFNYSSAGVKVLNCSVGSDEGNDSSSVAFEVKGAVIEAYNRTLADGNTLLVRFNVTNYYFPRVIGWSVSSGGQMFTGSTGMLQTGTSEGVVQEINYTTDGVKLARVNISGDGGLADSVSELFLLKGVGVEGYYSFNRSASERMFEFFVKNFWNSSVNAAWNITDPLVVGSSLSLSEGESVWVFVNANYTAPGFKKPVANAYNGSFVSNVLDKFAVKFVEVSGFAVVVEGAASTVGEAFLRNNQGLRNLSWSFGTGERVVNGTSLSVNESDSLFVIVETNYSNSDVYGVNVSVNTSSFNDTAKSLVIV